MRKVVDFLETNFDTMKQEPSGRVILEDGIIRFEDMNERFIRDLYDFGIIGGKPPHPLFPKDGLQFLEGLQREFSGSAVRATAPREVK